GENVRRAGVKFALQVRRVFRDEVGDHHHGRCDIHDAVDDVRPGCLVLVASHHGANLPGSPVRGGAELVVSGAGAAGINLDRHDRVTIGPPQAASLKLTDEPDQAGAVMRLRTAGLEDVAVPTWALCDPSN